MKYFKILMIMIIIMFLGLFFAYQNGYYEKFNNEKKVLTDKMIKEYEEDLKKGIDVTKKEYVNIKPTYSNKTTNSILKLSHKIEKGIDKIIKYFFSKLSDSIND